MFRHIMLANKKIQKLKNGPIKPLKTKKEKKECSSELMLKTINVQTYQARK